MRYLIYNCHWKVMSNSPKMGHLPIPVLVKGLLPHWIPNAAGAVHTTSGRPNHSDVDVLCFAILTLWWTNIAMENHHFNGKIHYKWPFSIAMLVHQRVPEVFRHETLWSFMELSTCTQRRQFHWWSFFSLVTSCNRKIMSMYDPFFFKSTIVHQSRKSTPKKMPEEPRLLCVPCGRWTREHPHDKPATRFFKNDATLRRVFFWSRPRWTLCFQLLRLFKKKCLYCLDDEGTQFRNWTLGWPEGILGHANLDPSRMEWNACSLNLSETLVCPEQLLNWRRQWPILSFV